MSIEQCEAIIALSKKGYKAIYESREWGFIALTKNKKLLDCSKPRKINEILDVSDIFVERDGNVIWNNL